MVYAAEDAFHRLPIHWMWWPAIGGLVVGIGGLIFPEALGVGYDVIETLISGDATSTLILGVLLVKSTIWAVSLGSGTSGGVLAPLLMMGGALGGLEAMIFPDHGPGFWPIIGMAAILGGTMRAPLTGIVFTLELTHDVNLLLPLLCATAVAHGFTVLIMRRSILTEKIEPARLPCQPGVCGRSARGALRARRDADRGCRLAGRDAARRRRSSRSGFATTGTASARDSTRCSTNTSCWSAS